MERYIIVERYADNGELSHRALVDSTDGRELGTDGGEPEDQSFWRDWAWVPDEMNKLGNEIVTLRDERDRLAELVRQAQPHVCSLLCPSVKARHELWTHTKLCLNMQAVLTPAKGVQQHPAFDEYGEHRQPTGLGDL